MNLKNNWGIWLGLVIVIGFSVLALVSVGGNKLATGVPLTTEGIVAGDHVKGNPNAKALLIAYSDFQCPACAAYEPLLEQLSKEFPDTLAIVYRNFPLRTIHPNADAAAQAAEAADKQGKFWEMHDMLYAKQVDWEKSSDAKKLFTDYAVQLGLKKDQFEADMNSDAIRAKVNADYASAISMGLQGTPTFFLNGTQLISNPQGYEPFKALIQAELKK